MTLGIALRQIGRLWSDGAVAGYSDAQLLERFVASHDASAFEALVARHGPMVLSACRGVLKDPNDAEDAFQAAFLILVKKSGSLRGPVALGPWLHQVAFRVALRANASAARRRDCERKAGLLAGSLPVASPAVDPATDESMRALHEEIARLPEKFQRPLILCDLEHVSQALAAGELRVSERTLQRRLREARTRLKARLTRRGLVCEEGMLAAALLRVPEAVVLPAWGEAVVRLAVAGNPLVAAGVSASARTWIREVLRGLLIPKLKLASAVLLGAGLLAWGASAAVQGGGSSRRPESQPRPRLALAALQDEPKAAKAETPWKLSFRGKVVGPDRQPMAGASLYVTPASGYLKQPYPSSVMATTGKDGAFAFDLNDSKYQGWGLVVAAEAPGFGAGWVRVLLKDRRDDLMIPLVKDDVPITGQVVDLEGRPVAGASLRLMQINASPEENLGPWIEATRAKQGDRYRLEQEYLSRITIAPVRRTVTNAEGRFRLDGIGNDRLATVLLDGPTIASQYLHVMTRAGQTLELPAREGPAMRYYGADFRHSASPTKPVVGVVRDRDTKAPLVGFTIQSYKLANDPIHGLDITQTTTDAQGRYRLTGLPKGVDNKIVIIASGDQPYLSVWRQVPDTVGLDPVTFDLELKRGIWIEGKITDKATGGPVRAYVEYFSRRNNPSLRDHPGYEGTFMLGGWPQSCEDGSYRVVGLPGPGLVVISRKDGYLSAPERDDEFGAREPNYYNTAPYVISFPGNHDAIAPIDIPKDAETGKKDLTLDPGWSFSGKVVGPDGNPLLGAQGFGVINTTPGAGYGEPLQNGEFLVLAFNPRRPRALLVQHREKGLIGEVPVPEEPRRSVTVHMQAVVKVKGRLVDAAGKPQAGVSLEGEYRRESSMSWKEYYPVRNQKTDEDGHFRLDALLPGCEFRLIADRDTEVTIDARTLKSGPEHDLGDLRVSKYREP
ncbi:sigma-70 family RNA polymerase sigma factor [Singulisphaera sp. PoT]|uniref:sigma-70 family RNA polymerase sigma factor n=1 Tax=Singulisphaera sp. PoT TaxID=3411797 RepID=UPI003BF4B8FE